MHPTAPVGDAARLIRTGWQRLIAAVLDCEKPVIAAVNATAAGGGMHLALACDLVLAAEEATFIEVFVRRGIAPDAGGAYLLPRLIGAAEGEGALLLRGRPPGAGGRANGSRQPGGAASRAAWRAPAQWAARLAAGPTKAIAAAKYLTNRSLESDRAAALWDEAVAQELVVGTDDCREGLRRVRRAARARRSAVGSGRTGRRASMRLALIGPARC